MRVGLDARFLTHPQVGGFKAYLKGLVEGLARLEPAPDVILYVDRVPTDGEPPAPPPFPVRLLGGAAPFVGLPWREQVRLPIALARDGVDVLHAPCHTAPLWRSAPLVVTVHDMLWRTPSTADRRGMHRALLSQYYQTVTMAAIRRARAVLTVSETSRRAICDELPFVDAATVWVTPNAPRACFHPIADAERARVAAELHLPPRFILAQASADPRKNLPTLIEAFARLRATGHTDYSLVIAWAHAHLAPAAHELAMSLGVADHMRPVFDVSDERLAALYSMAAAFAFPSLAEGFGMPILEAMACGAPVITGDHPAVIETAGGASLIVDVRSADSLAAGLARVLTDEGLRASLQARGAARARQFTWEACARVTMQAYEVAASRRMQD